MDFRGVNRVAAVVARTVCNEGDLFFIRFAIGARRDFVKECANRMDDFKVRFFILTKDIIGHLNTPASCTSIREPIGAGS